MIRSGFFAFLLILLILAGPTQIFAANIPVEPYVEASFATEGPLSLFCSPNGAGNPFTEAFNQFGDQVDGTLTIILYDDMPPWGEPVANFPSEDIWLMDIDGDLAVCPGGSICDQNTDPDGMTFWSNPLLAGHHAEPVGGNQVAIVINGWVLDSPALSDFRINSADLNGDLWVSLHDVVLFTEIYFGPYAYEGDFHWDGVVNLSDLAAFTRTYGTQCP
jgi:hypothetical protein